MSVRMQLVFWNAVVFAIVLTGLGLTLRERVRANLTEGIQKDLQARSEGIASVLLEMPVDQKLPRPDIAHRIRSRDVAGIMPRVFDAEEHLLGPMGADPDAAPLDRATLRKAFHGGNAVFTTVRQNGQPAILVYTYPVQPKPHQTRKYVVQTAQSLESVDREVRMLTAGLLTQIPMALGLVAVGTLFLTQRALRPVALVTRTAAEIEATDLSRRLAVTGQDEFARLAETLNGMLARLERAFELQRRFVADASHELKSPLTIIKANSSLSLSDPNLPEEIRLSLTEIDSGADRTIQLVQDLLLIARSDAGDLAPRYEDFPVRPLLRELAKQGQQLHPDGPTLDVDAPEDLEIVADREQIRRLMTNLRDNALRYTPPTGSVTLRAMGNEAGVLLQVIDTGVGIAPEHLARLGERFYRPDRSRTRDEGGTGLGLSICRAIVTAHHGTMEIQSRVSEGTTITVILPLSNILVSKLKISVDRLSFLTVLFLVEVG